MVIIRIGVYPSLCSPWTLLAHFQPSSLCLVFNSPHSLFTHKTRRIHESVYAVVYLLSIAAQQNTPKLSGQKQPQSFILLTNLQFGQGLAEMILLCSKQHQERQLNWALADPLSRGLIYMANKLVPVLGWEPSQSYALWSLVPLHRLPGLPHSMVSVSQKWMY